MSKENFALPIVSYIHRGMIKIKMYCLGMCMVVDIPLEQFSVHSVKGGLRLSLRKVFERFCDISQ